MHNGCVHQIPPVGTKAQRQLPDVLSVRVHPFRRGRLQQQEGRPHAAKDLEPGLVVGRSRHLLPLPLPLRVQGNGLECQPAQQSEPIGSEHGKVDTAGSGGPGLPGVLGTAPTRRKQTVRKISTLDKSTALRSRALFRRPRRGPSPLRGPQQCPTPGVPRR